VTGSEDGRNRPPSKRNALGLRQNAAVALAVLMLVAFPAALVAQGVTRGSMSGLPLPRFASIKSQPVNIRMGPSLGHEIAWTFKRSGVPVEITQEFDIWYRVRDSEGQEGWIQKTLLSGKRTALIAPWDKDRNVPLHDKAGSSTLVANMEPNVLVDVLACDGAWCRITVEGYRGFVEQSRLWGIYPRETYPSD
jgi:SH3-like domain-containing protein